MVSKWILIWWNENWYCHDGKYIIFYNRLNQTIGKSSPLKVEYTVLVKSSMEMLISSNNLLDQWMDYWITLSSTLSEMSSFIGEIWTNLKDSTTQWQMPLVNRIYPTWAISMTIMIMPDSLTIKLPDTCQIKNS